MSKTVIELLKEKEINPVMQSIKSLKQDKCPWFIHGNRNTSYFPKPFETKIIFRAMKFLGDNNKYNKVYYPSLRIYYYNNKNNLTNEWHEDGIFEKPFDYGFFGILKYAEEGGDLEVKNQGIINFLKPGQSILLEHGELHRISSVTKGERISFVVWFLDEFHVNKLKIF